MSFENLSIGLVGGGNMARALVRGLLQAGHPASRLDVADPDPAQLEQVVALHAGVGIHADNTDLARSADVLVLAVKPQQMKAALAPIAGRLGGQLVLSIAAGLRLADLGRWLGAPGAPHARLVRCMPNTPALIGAGVTGLYADPSVDAAGREAAGRILGAVGSIVWADTEAQMDAVTAISGSGPAYVFHFIEALESAGRSLGFDEAGARRLAIDTVLGAARLAAGSEDAPAVLRQKVTSKGGTTEAALASLAAAGWHDELVAAVQAAEARGRELGAELGKD